MSADVGGTAGGGTDRKKRIVIDSTLLIIALGTVASFFDASNDKEEITRRLAILEAKQDNAAIRADIQRLESRIDALHNLWSNRPR